MVKLMKDGPHYAAICVTGLAAILLCSSIDLQTLILFDNCLVSEINHGLIFYQVLIQPCKRICTSLWFQKVTIIATSAWKTLDNIGSMSVETTLAINSYNEVTLMI